MRWTTWLRVRLFLMIDRLFGTHLVEQELARHQIRVDQLVSQLRAVNQDLGGMAERLDFFRLVLCLIALKARSERDDLGDWLRFEPQSPGEETLLDSVIDYLVKPQLATIDAKPVDAGGYVYRLHPDWLAISACLSEAAVAPELMSWLEDQV